LFFWKSTSEAMVSPSITDPQTLMNSVKLNTRGNIMVRHLPVSLAITTEALKRAKRTAEANIVFKDGKVKFMDSYCSA
jgi:hypothetical protein